MNRMERLRSISLLAAVVALAAAALPLGWWALTALVAGLVLWSAMLRLPADTGNALFLALLGCATGGYYIGFYPAALLAALLSALAYWDLNAFLERSPGSDPELHALEQAHLRRLLLVLGMGFALGLAGLLLSFKLSVGWALLASLIALIGIRAGIGIVLRS